jgi:hypothetical protein
LIYFFDFILSTGKQTIYPVFFTIEKSNALNKRLYDFLNILYGLLTTHLINQIFLYID